MAGFGTMASRFVVVYLAIFALRMASGQIVLLMGRSLPGVEWLFGRFDLARQAAVMWAAKTACGAAVQPDGRWASYAEVALLVALSLAVAVAWGWAAGCRPLAARTRDLVRILVRFTLAVATLSYGFNKVFPNQFSSVGPHKLMQPFCEASPVALLWTFMGYSTTYTMFAGWLEVVGGMLLFWRRTTLLGALILAGSLVNVVMLNVCYDVGVEVEAVHLLLMAAFLIGPDGRRLLDLLILNHPVPQATLPPSPVANRRLRAVFVAGKVLLVAWALFWNVSRNQHGERTPNPIQGFYRVESFAMDGVRDRELPDARRWVRVAVTSRGNEVSYITMQYANGDQEIAKVLIDPSNRDMNLFVMPVREDSRDVACLLKGGAPNTSLHYELAVDGGLALEGRFRGRAVTARLVRQSPEAFPLLHRRFDWRNDDVWFWR